jgi:hypothetical protein
VADLNRRSTVEEPTVTSANIWHAQHSPWSNEPHEPSELGKLIEAARQRDDKGRMMWQALRQAMMETPDHGPLQLEAFKSTEPPIVYVREPVVYYVRFADRVKIGTTTNLGGRLNGIPYDEVLATEPGGYELEAQRHREFAADRIVGEWFTYSDRLRRHIETL